MEMHSRNDSSTFHYSQHRNTISVIIYTGKTCYIMSILYSGSLNIGNDIVINLYQSVIKLYDHCVLLASILSKMSDVLYLMNYDMLSMQNKT